MKKTLVIFLLCAGLFAAGRPYLGLEYRLQNNWEEITQMTGGHAGVYWGPFSLGGAAYTSIAPVDFSFEDDSYTLKRLTYGGVDIRFMPESFSFINITANCMMGASLLNFDDESPLDDDFFLMVEPGLELMLNISAFIRLGYGVTWRGTLTSDFKQQEEISGLSYNFIAQFGKLNP